MKGKRRINSMVSAQTRRVQERVAQLTRAWLDERGASVVGLVEALGFADFNRDLYIGVARLTFTTAEGRTVTGELMFELDADFEPVGPPVLKELA